jgi:hypothetical protein
MKTRKTEALTAEDAEYAEGYKDWRVTGASSRQKGQ